MRRGNGAWIDTGTLAYNRENRMWTVERCHDNTARMGDERVRWQRVSVGDHYTEALCCVVRKGVAYCEVHAKKDIGCRVWGTILSAIAARCGNRAMPCCIFVSSKRGRLNVRGLLAISVLSNRADMERLWRGFELKHLPAPAGCKPSGYERLARDRFGKGEELERSHLHKGLRGVCSSPDGLFRDMNRRVLTVIEAKLRKQPDFADGAAQILQYFAQAQAKQRPFPRVRSLLVCSKKGRTRSFSVWEAIMRSGRPMRIYVRARDLPPQVRAVGTTPLTARWVRRGGAREPALTTREPL